MTVQERGLGRASDAAAPDGGVQEAENGRENKHYK